MTAADCKGYICGNFEQCICETRNIEIDLENLRNKINEFTRMSDEIVKYIFNILIDEMIEIKNLVSKINSPPV